MTWRAPLAVSPGRRRCPPPAHCSSHTVHMKRATDTTHTVYTQIQNTEGSKITKNRKNDHVEMLRLLMVTTYHNKM